jgi:ceramide kinase
VGKVKKKKVDFFFPSLVKSPLTIFIRIQKKISNNKIFFYIYHLGRAQFVYEKKVLPIFKEANITVNSIYTVRANEAQEYVINEDLSDYDGLICVGGDGMFAELCHGLLLRTSREAQLNIDDPQVNIIRPNLRIGIIPAGSTDAVVFGTTGLNDPVTSALQIIVGESLSIDIATVTKILFLLIFSMGFSFKNRFIMKKDLYVLWQQCLPMDFLVILFINQINGVV